MRGRVAFPVLLVMLLVAAPAHAVFHLAVIDGVMSGASGDPTVQYVEVRMLAPLQTDVCHSRLTVFRCKADGGGSRVLIDNLGGADAANPCLPNDGADVRWIMASPSAVTFLTDSGINPDFTWDSSVTGGIPTSCGMVCWGAPGTLTPPPNPPNWDATNPLNYVDCVAYGAYDGTAEPLGNPPASATPGSGTLALTRTDSAMFSNQFDLACPAPTNNDGAMGTFAPCSVTTTTTSPGATTTTARGHGTTTTTRRGATTTTTTPVPPSSKNKCSPKELQAAAKKVSTEVRCQAKAAVKGSRAKLPACVAKADATFAAAYARAIASGGCRTAVTAATVESAVDGFVADLGATLTGGSTAASKCTSRQLAAAGAKASAMLRCHAKAVAKGSSAKLAGCVASAAARFAKAYGKASGAGGCLEAVGAATVEDAVDAFVAATRATIAP
ncbi:MAG TPA: hypothetical protein VKU61_09710 [Candidatus Binatia bacterium]|nr:hypothetical protein [Candidatus Binatia bacterium]